MVPMHDLDDDYYDFDERNFCRVGRRHHYKYQLGDAIRIRVAKANLEKKQLDFTLADSDRRSPKHQQGGGEQQQGAQKGKRKDRKSHTSELQSRQYLVCRLLLEKKTTNII